MTVFAILALLLGILSVLTTGLLCVGFLILITGVKVRTEESEKAQVRRTNGRANKKS